jgi:hypothetical protein
MKTGAIFILLCAIHLPSLSSSKHMPRDVQVFAKNDEACEHEGGEYDSELPAEQKRDIERKVRKYCGAASRQLRNLRIKYQRDPAMLEAIERHANVAVTDYR